MNEIILYSLIVFLLFFLNAKISYKLNSFMDVMSFANLISDKSEQIKHHPKIIIDYNVIEFNLTTHDVGGISKLDFQLATFIHETYNELFTPDL